MFESITVTARYSFEYSKPLDIGSLRLAQRLERPVAFSEANCPHRIEADRLIEIWATNHRFKLKIQSFSELR